MIQPAALSLLNLTPGRAAPSPVASGAVFALPGDGGDATAVLPGNAGGGERQADAAPGKALPLDLATAPAPAPWPPLAATAAVVIVEPTPAPALAVEQPPVPIPAAAAPAPVAIARDPAAEPRLVPAPVAVAPSNAPAPTPLAGQPPVSTPVTIIPEPVALDRNAPIEQPHAPTPATTGRLPTEPVQKPTVEQPDAPARIATVPLPTVAASQATVVERKSADEPAAASPKPPSTRARRGEAPVEDTVVPDTPVAPIATSVSIDVRPTEQAGATPPASALPTPALSSPALPTPTSTPLPPVATMTASVDAPRIAPRLASTTSEPLPLTTATTTPLPRAAPASDPVDRAVGPVPEPVVADATAPMLQDAAVVTPPLAPQRDVAEHAPAQPFRFYTSLAPSLPPVAAEVPKQSIAIQPDAGSPSRTATALSGIAATLAPTPAKGRPAFSALPLRTGQEPRPSPTPMVAPPIALPLNWQRIMPAASAAPTVAPPTASPLPATDPLAPIDSAVAAAAPVPVPVKKEAPIARASPSDHPAAPVAPLMPITQAAPAALVFGAARFAAQVADDRDEPTLAPVLGMAPLAAPAAVERPAVAAPSQAPLDTTREHWPTTMIERIEMIRDAADEVDTRIRLIPDALGAIDVAVKRDGDTLHVRFQADQPQTRALLADAAPRLAEAAEARGLRLGQSSVGGDAGATGHGNQPHQQQRPSLPAAPPRAPRHPVADETADDDTRLA